MTTEQLKIELQQAYAEVLLKRAPMLDDAAYDEAWRRVAERAKELVLSDDGGWLRAIQDKQEAAAKFHAYRSVSRGAEC